MDTLPLDSHVELEAFKEKEPRVYVVFNGKVRIYPTCNTNKTPTQNQRKEIDIVVQGETGVGQVIGTFDQQGCSIDRYVAEAIVWEEEIRKDGNYVDVLRTQEALRSALDLTLLHCSASLLDLSQELYSFNSNIEMPILTSLKPTSAVSSRYTRV